VAEAKAEAEAEGRVAKELTEALGEVNAELARERSSSAAALIELRLEEGLRARVTGETAMRAAPHSPENENSAGAARRSPMHLTNLTKHTVCSKARSLETACLNPREVEALLSDQSLLRTPWSYSERRKEEALLRVQIEELCLDRVGSH